MDADGPVEEGLAARLGGWPAWLALSFMVGTGLGLAGSPVFPAVATAAIVLGVMAWQAYRRRWHRVAWLAVVAACPLAAAWAAMDANDLRQPSLARYVPGGESVLARVTGEIEGTVRDIDHRRGAFGDFAYRAPGTLAQLRVERIDVGEGFTPVDGGLLLQVGEHDHTLREGQRVEAIGWLAAIEPPSNPGEFDFAELMRSRGVVGRLAMASRGNWRTIDTPWHDLPYWMQRMRTEVSEACLSSLRQGLRDAGPARGLLETLLLGHWGDEMGELRESFRHVGLAHVLSISGAHLGILMGMVWLIARLVAPNPPRAAMIVLAVLLMYLAALPMRAPIVRAAIMAGVFCVAYAVGRRPRPMACLSVAAVAVLLWRPSDLVSPGFQLSFGVVAGLLLWTEGVSRMLLPPPVIEPVHPTMSQRLTRMGVDYAAVSLIAFGVAAPLVAYHYQLVSPAAMVTSILAIPVLTAVLAAGYAKIVLGLIAGEVGGLLAGPLLWFSRSLIGLVEEAERWPWSSFVIAALAAVVAAASGKLRGRWVVGVGLAGVVMVSLWATTQGGDGRPTVRSVAGVEGVEDVEDVDGAGNVAAGVASKGPASASNVPAARLSMLAVGDGSCFVLELPGHVLMFDGGTQAYLDVGLRSIVPALEKWGIDRIDTLVISHADLDHYAGLLDVIDHMPVGRVLTTPHLLAEAQAKPGTSTAFLVAELRRRGLVPETVTQGWKQEIAHATLTALWPAADFQAERNNDHSLVLSVHLELPGTDRRLLLNGDIQHAAKPVLLDAHRRGELDLRAHVTDLPHHGSFVDASPDWLDAVDPAVVLQSSGRARLRNDPWADTLRDHQAKRYITPEHGCTTLTIHADGRIAIETFR
ncbi:MAG: ComEC/Rec2 family competence protein [Phycisphaeraceae bacterium]